MKKTTCLLMGLLLLNMGYANNPRINKTKFAILIPMLDESIQLLNDMNEKKYTVIDGVHYIEGTINGHTVVFANTGLGKTNMSLITSRLIHDYHPDFIFLAGSAGNLNPALDKHSIVVGARVIDADLGTLTEEGPYYPSEEYFTTPQKENLPIPKSYAPNSQLTNTVQHLIEELPQSKILLGAIATSDFLPNTMEQTKLLKLNKIDAVEMEGASFMQACWLFDTNCIVIRGISNNVDEEISKEDTIQAGSNAAGFVKDIINFLDSN